MAYDADVETADAEAEEVDVTADESTIDKETPEGADWNPVEDAFLRRRSVRKYKKKQVPEHLIRRILEVGRFAPSQGNCQPWKFVVVRDQDTIEEMEQYCVATCKKIKNMVDYTVHEEGTFARFRKRLLTKILTKRDPNTMHPVPLGAASLIADDRFAVFHKAPTVILLLMDKRGIGHPQIDIGICGTHISVAAHSLGLGACWVGFAAILARSEEWKKRLGIEEPYELLEAIVVGYPKGNPTASHVSRETHEIAWIENHETKIYY